MDIAAAYGDARVYDIVKTKWDSLPPPSDKKKKGKGAAKKSAKRPKSSGDGKVCEVHVVEREVLNSVCRRNKKLFLWEQSLE